MPLRRRHMPPRRRQMPLRRCQMPLRRRQSIFLLGAEIPRSWCFYRYELTSSEIHADGQLEVGDVCVDPHLPRIERGNLQRSSVSQLRQGRPTKVVGPRAATSHRKQSGCHIPENFKNVWCTHWAYIRLHYCRIWLRVNQRKQMSAVFLITLFM